MSSSNRTALILILIIISVAGFAYAIPVVPVTYEESYQVDVPYDEQEEYTVQVPYQDTEPYTELEPYEVVVPVTIQVETEEEVEVTKTHIVFERINNEYGINLYYSDISLVSSIYLDISWSSSKNVMLFAMIDTSHYQSLYTGIIVDAGLAVLTTILSGGILAPFVIEGLPAKLALTVATNLSPSDYYSINSDGGTTTKYLIAGEYRLVMLNIYSDNILNIRLSNNRTANRL